MDQILRDSGGELTLSTYDAGGAPADVNGTEAPTLAVTDSGGTSVAGFTPSRTGPGAYKATLPGNLEVLDSYDIVWSWTNGQSRRTQFELVGGFLYSIAELRADDPALADAVAYPAALIRDWRAAILERFTKVTRVSFVLRGRRAFLDGKGRSELLLPDIETQRVVSLKVDGVALSAGNLAKVKVYPHGELLWDGGSFAAGFRNVEVLYEYGMVSTPEAVARVARRFARHLLLTAAPNSAAEEHERATAVFTDAGGYRLTIAGRDGPTGLPEVDAVLAQFTHKLEGFA